MNAPDEIHHVSRTQFSIARHSGGCRAYGHYYYYDPAHDCLIRDDVLVARRAAEKAAKRAEMERLHATQGTLPW